MRQIIILMWSMALIVQGICAPDAPAAQSTNMAAGLTAQFDPKPSYPLCTDDSDERQLTDGVYSSGRNDSISGPGATSIWGQKTTVGWMHATPLTISFDLGRRSSIEGVSLSAAAGASGVFWPRAIALMVSDDNQNWRYLGDLITLSRQSGLPPVQEYSVHRFVARGLKAQARYITFVVTVSGTPFFFTDEIEIYGGGTDSSPEEKPLRSFADINAAKQFVMDSATGFGISQRLSRDYAAVRAAIETSKLPQPDKARLVARLEGVAREIDTVVPPAADTFQTILPLNETHRRILQVYGSLQAARGASPFYLRKNHRYAYVEWLDLLEKSALQTTDLKLAMLGHEKRSDAFWMSNASPNDCAVRLTITAPRGARAGWIKLYSVPWTDTAQNAPVATALLPLKPDKGGYALTIPAGMSGKLWVTIDSQYLSPGKHVAALNVQANKKSYRVPITVDVSRHRLPKTPLMLSMWDYTDRDGLYGINKANLPASIALMREYGVNAPWGSPSVLPFPTAADFDTDNALTKPLDFTLFDEWVKRWPKAEKYCVFINQHTKNFAGASLETPEFDARLGAWARALAQHMRELKLQPQQLVLLAVDEPSADEHDEIIAGWLNAIRKGAPELGLFSDPVWPDPRQSKHQEALTLPDILCPNVQIFLRNAELSERYYSERQAAGQELWFYECSAAARLSDPTRYYRFQSWLAYRYGARGVNFWSFGDTGGALTSWNEYTAGRGLSFAPAFLGRSNVHASIQLEAIREGMQDYQTFTLLKSLGTDKSTPQTQRQALALLSPDSLDKVCGDPEPDYTWMRANENQHGQADQFRLQAVRLIDQMS